MTSAPSTALAAELASLALDVNAANLALGHETFEAEGARFVRNRLFPRIYDANHVSHVTAASGPEVERLLARVEAENLGIGHRRFDVDFRTPPAFVARLVPRRLRADRCDRPAARRQSRRRSTRV